MKIEKKIILILLFISSINLYACNCKYNGNLEVLQNIEFNKNANSDDVEKFINWIKKFTVNKVKTETYYDSNNNLNLKIYYK